MSVAHAAPDDRLPCYQRDIGYVYGLVSFSVICALVLGLFGVFRCLRATTTSATRATAEALTLPIQFLTDDLAPLNADLNHLPVPSPAKTLLRSGNVRGQWTAGAPSSALGSERE
uniref:Uncharacterized protein n=1 Tax=Anopheles dirus TaxID=7168 RepID=A0A182N7M4_9DIPT